MYASRRTAAGSGSPSPTMLSVYSLSNLYVKTKSAGTLYMSAAAKWTARERRQPPTRNSLARLFQITVDAWYHFITNCKWDPAGRRSQKQLKLTYASLCSRGRRKSGFIWFVASGNILPHRTHSSWFPCLWLGSRKLCMSDNASVRRAQDNGFCGMSDTADTDLEK